MHGCTDLHWQPQVVPSYSSEVEYFLLRCVCSHHDGRPYMRQQSNEPQMTETLSLDAQHAVVVLHKEVMPRRQLLKLLKHDLIN